LFTTTKNIATEYQNGTPDGEVYTVNNNTFDTKSNLAASLPLWIYFRVYNEDDCLSYTPGAHNPLTSDASQYSYQYNSNGYLSAISLQAAGLESYTYQYTTAN